MLEPCMIDKLLSAVLKQAFESRLNIVINMNAQEMIAHLEFT